MVFTMISQCYRVQLDETITRFSVVRNERKLEIVKIRDKGLTLPWGKKGGLNLDPMPNRDPTKLVAFTQRLKSKILLAQWFLVLILNKW